MRRSRLETEHAETIVQKIKHHFYNDNYVDHYIHYDDSLQKLHPYGADKCDTVFSATGYADDVPAEG